LTSLAARLCLFSGAILGCQPTPPRVDCDLALELDAAGCAAAHAMTRPDALPPAVGNAVADDPAAAELGFALFFDRSFSSNGRVACGTCHEPSTAFTDWPRATPNTLGPVARNTQAITDLAYSRWFFWDGRADSLWAQATFPVESPAEMGMTRLGVAHILDASYRSRYEAVFGPLPDTSAWPEAGMPGQPAYDALPAEVRYAADEILANFGKAIEAYERRLVTGDAAVDRFLEGDEGALSPQAIEGFTLFVRAGCVDCHRGPTLSDDAFHNVGTSRGTPEGRGRAAVYDVVESSTFGSHGPYFDGDPTGAPALLRSSGDEGAFRTPLLRGVSRTAPYGHDGRWATLEVAVREHAQADATEVGELDALWRPSTLDAAEVAAIVAFLEALEGDPPPIPWSRWPSG
jgi:cytochrome c peroxidase